MMASEKLFGLHATALQLRSQRMMMLASNIANAATPNYKARDLDFREALRSAEEGQQGEQSRPKNADPVPRAGAGIARRQHGRTGDRADGLSPKTRVAYRTSLAFLNGRVSTLSRALKGE
jgi:flagellar basal-body rod protein FlgB